MNDEIKREASNKNFPVSFKELKFKKKTGICTGAA
jgi:hypothetical protein